MFNLEAIANSTNTYLIVKDRHFKYLYCSESYAEFLDLDSPKKNIGRIDSDFFSESGAKTCSFGDQLVLNGHTLADYPEVITTRHNNESVRILTSKNILKTSGYIKIAASFIYTYTFSFQ